MSAADTLPHLAVETIQAMSEEEFEAWIEANEKTYLLTENGVSLGVVLVPVKDFEVLMEAQGD